MMDRVNEKLQIEFYGLFLKWFVICDKLSNKVHCKKNRNILENYCFLTLLVAIRSTPHISLTII